MSHASSPCTAASAPLAPLAAGNPTCNPQDTVRAPYDTTRAFAVKVVPKRRPVFPFSGFDLYHHFRCVLWPLQAFKSPENGKTGRRFETTFRPILKEHSSGTP